MTTTEAPITISLRALREDAPGKRLAKVFRAYWPAYESWMARDRRSRVRASDARIELRRHMPELEEIFDALLAAVDGGSREARFLSLWRPPPLVRGCSQAVWTGIGGPALVRNYDHAPQLFDGIVLRSAWRDMPVLAVTDCLWGALDGVNGAGLCVALAFGGRETSGDGFAAPLVVRYLLETCHDVDDAAQALQRVPVHMPYTFVLLDSSGRSITAYCAPDRETVFAPTLVSTNHQGAVEWVEYARFSRTVEREHVLRALLHDPSMTLPALVAAFGRAPLWRTTWERGSGTLYTSCWSPLARAGSFTWPGASTTYALDDFREGTFEVCLRA